MKRECFSCPICAPVILFWMVIQSNTLDLLTKQLIQSFCHPLWTEALNLKEIWLIKNKFWVESMDILTLIFKPLLLLVISLVLIVLFTLTIEFNQIAWIQFRYSQKFGRAQHGMFSNGFFFLNNRQRNSDLYHSFLWRNTQF